MAMTEETRLALIEARLKNIESGAVPGLDFLLSLNPLVYTWKDGENTERHYGLSAQQTKSALELAGEDNTALVNDPGNGEYLSIRYTELIPVLIQSIQEQQEQIDALKAQIKGMK